MKLTIKDPWLCRLLLVLAACGIITGIITGAILMGRMIL